MSCIVAGSDIVRASDGCSYYGLDKLSNAGDVNISSATNGQTIIWDSTNNQWINSDVNSGSLSHFQESVCNVGTCRGQNIFRLITDCDDADIVLCTKGAGSISNKSFTNADSNNSPGCYGVDFGYGTTAPGNDSTSPYSTVSGGHYNFNCCSCHSVISGGYYNSNSISSSSVVSGGYGNENSRSIYSVISGGYVNYNHTSSYSVISGGIDNCNNDSTFSAISGGFGNINDNSSYSVISGGWCNLNYNSIYSAISGGSCNSNCCSDYSFLFGKCGQVGQNSNKMFSLAFGDSCHSNSTDDFNIVYSVDKDGTVCTTNTLCLMNLPTSDPAVANQVWNDGGILKISAG